MIIGEERPKSADDKNLGKELVLEKTPDGKKLIKIIVKAYVPGGKKVLRLLHDLLSRIEPTKDFQAQAPRS